MSFKAVQNRLVLDVYQTPNKSRLMEFVDTYNEGIYKLFGGRRYTFDKTLTIKEIGFDRSDKRTFLNVICTVAFPVLLITLGIKYFNKDNYNRYQAVNFVQKNEASRIIGTAFRKHLFRRRLKKHIEEKNKITVTKIFKATVTAIRTTVTRAAQAVNHVRNMVVNTAATAVNDFAENHPKAYRSVVENATYYGRLAAEKTVRRGVLYVGCAITMTNAALVGEAVAIERFLDENGF